MTDEEMAEEYVRNHVYYEVAKRENGAEYAKEVSNVTVKEAFLAGLKAGGLQWHKVSDGDLPPVERGSVTINVLTDSGNIAYYFYDESCWYDFSGNEIALPKAWCNIPKFEEKKI